jgi:hypothetical protein
MHSVTGIFCQACGESARLDPDQLVVAAAEIATFTDAHSQHETWGFALLTDAQRRNQMSDSN